MPFIVTLGELTMFKKLTKAQKAVYLKYIARTAVLKAILG